MRRPDAVGRGG